LKALLPADFFHVKEEVTPKAPLQVLYKFAAIGYSIVIIVFFGLLANDLNQTVTTRETLIVQAPDPNLECTALGYWSSKVRTDDTYNPVERDGTNLGIELSMIDVSLTSAQCIERSNSAAFCQSWADRFVGDGQCCLESPALATRWDPDFNCGGAPLCGASSAVPEYSCGHALAILTFNGTVDIRDAPCLDGNRGWSDQPTVAFNNISSTPRSMFVLNLCSSAGSAGVGRSGGGFGSTCSAYSLNRDATMNYVTIRRGLNEYATMYTSLLTHADFVSDCQTRVNEVCARVDLNTQPFACIKENVIRRTVLEASGTAFANTQFVGGLIFSALGLLAAKLHTQQTVPQGEARATAETGGVTV